MEEHLGEIMDSILTSVKKMLGIAEEYDAFDNDLIIHINSVFSILTQLGVGPIGGYYIEGPDETWDEFIGTDPRLSLVKTYTYMKVKSNFDPPQQGSVAEAMKRTIDELEWRINKIVEIDNELDSRYEETNEEEDYEEDKRFLDFDINLQIPLPKTNNEQKEVQNLVDHMYTSFF